MNEFFIVFSVTSFLLSLLACFFSVKSAARVRELQGRLELLPWSRLLSIDNSLQEHMETLSSLANRVKMMKVRNAITHTDRDKGGEPDAKSDPEGWRAWKNAQLRATNVN